VPYHTLLAAHGARCRLSRRGDGYDNAVAESFFSTLKTELGASRWPSRAQAARAVGESIDRFYNPRRLHSTAGSHSPMDAEAAFEARV
jgi:putative transposase